MLGFKAPAARRFRECAVLSATLAPRRLFRSSSRACENWSTADTIRRESPWLEQTANLKFGALRENSVTLKKRSKKHRLTAPTASATHAGQHMGARRKKTLTPTAIVQVSTSSSITESSRIISN